MSNVYLGCNVTGLLGNIICMGCVTTEPSTNEVCLFTYPDSLYIPLTEVSELRLLTGLELTHCKFPLNDFRHWKQIMCGG